MLDVATSGAEVFEGALLRDFAVTTECDDEIGGRNNVCCEILGARA